MRTLCFVATLVSGACGAAAPAEPTTSTAPVPTDPHPGERHADEANAKLDALVARAEQALVDDLKLDYERPFAKKVLERPETVELLLDACRAGHQPSCWKAATIAPKSEQARLYELVAANCRGGHLLSCRALPDQLGVAEPVYTDLPGLLGRSGCTEPTACDSAALKRECDAGFAQSCNMAGLQSSSPERDQVIAREAKLAAEDCAAGIVTGCFRLHDVPATEQLAVWEQACVLERGSCGLASGRYDELKRPTDARDSLERGCEYGANPKTCAELGAAYLDHKYEEPVAGRGQQLVNDACRKLGTYGAKVPACKRASK